MMWSSAAFLTLATAITRLNAAVGAASALANVTAKTDLNQSGACKAALEHYCAHVEPGGGRKAHCLRSQALAAADRKEQPLPVACRIELSLFFVHAVWNKTQGVEPVEGFNEACESDISKYCKMLRFNTQWTAKCLQNKAARDRHALSEPCKRKVFQIRMHEARNMELDVNLTNACRGDLDRIQACRRLPRFGKPGAKKACLMEHRKELSGACADSLFTRLQEDYSDIRLNQVVFQTCKPEISTFCGGVSFGEARILKCLWAKKGEPNFGTGCRSQVWILTKNKLKDYHLDFRIRTRCEKDIGKLCAAEQELVDNLHAAELFGDSWQEGKSGKVLQCLKANYEKISQPECKPEIKRLVRTHSEAPDMDPIFARKCKADVAKFCDGIDPEKVHLCLRKNINSLSKECKDVEILHGSVAATDISMKPWLERACAKAIKVFCSDVPHSEGQVVQCLEDHLEEDEGEEMSVQCRTAIWDDLEASNHDWRLKYGVHHGCKEDVARLCAEEAKGAGGKVLACLKRKRASIKQEDCKVQVSHMMKSGINDIKLATDTYDACIQDVQRFCTDIQPGQGRVHTCLVQHRKSLSRPCAVAEFEEQMIIAEDIRMDPKAARICKSSMKELCSDIEPGEGRLWECLFLWKDNPKMTQPCRAIVDAEEKLKNFEFHLNPKMAKVCGEDARNLCPVEIATADIKDFGSEGAVIGCLIAARKDVKSYLCKGMLLQKQVQRVADLRKDPEAIAYCDQDIKTFCKNEEDFQIGELSLRKVRNCLKKNWEQVSTPCNRVMTNYMVMTIEDTRMMGMMRKECFAARKRYCGDVPEGDGLVTVCMLRNMHAEDMEQRCTAKLNMLAAWRAKDLRFNPVVAKACKDDLAAMQANHTDEENCKWVDNQDVVMSGSGISCLVDHHREAKKASCQRALRDLMAMRSDSIAHMPHMAKACHNDIMALCGGVETGKGRIHACLRKNLTRISDKKCLQMVKSVLQAEQRDALLNPGVQHRCSNEVHAFCRNVERGESRLFICLRQHQKDQGFSSGCRQALDLLNRNYTLPVSWAQALTRENLHALLTKRDFWNTWGTAIMGALAVVLVSWLLGVIFLIRWLRKGRPVYGIEVETAEKEDG
mmetsp:Transcript_106857/g.297515  ORF Transcript_106857/g.297515 Transcript_106857/m.297515 type:complete len:1113 (+) Transcript_106857:71-3409(+)